MDSQLATSVGYIIYSYQLVCILFLCICLRAELVFVLLLARVCILFRSSQYAYYATASYSSSSMHNSLLCIVPYILQYAQIQLLDLLQPVVLILVVLYERAYKYELVSCITRLIQSSGRILWNQIKSSQSIKGRRPSGQ